MDKKTIDLTVALFWIIAGIVNIKSTINLKEEDSSRERKSYIQYLLQSLLLFSGVDTLASGIRQASFNLKN
jgi:hypothetical protein